MRVDLYGQNRHLVIVDGVPLSNFAEGDHLEVKLDGGAATRTHGGDGPGMSISTKQGGTVTIGLLPTSPALDILYALRDRIATSPYLFSVQLMTGVEEMITANGCAFGDTPAFTTGGPAMSGRKFQIECKELSIL
jgi:hypothetical protein